MSKKYLSCAETAKLMRGELKKTFPGQKFSVRSSVYSGGASIDVSWTDGPSANTVDKVVKKFAGATFDGMTDMKSYHDTEYAGETVSMGADFVFTRRSLSPEMEAKATELAKSRLICEIPANLETEPWNARVTGLREGGQHVYDGYFTQFVRITAEEMAA